MDPRSDPDPSRHGPGPHRRTQTRGVRPEAADAGLAADAATARLGVLAPELANLIDSTLRYVSLARARVAVAPQNAISTSAAEQLAAAAAGLQRMGELVHAAMQPCAGWLAQASAQNLSLRDAIDHALDVLRPYAAERLVMLERQCNDRLAEAPAGPLYTVVSNGLRNAIEASPRGGRVRIEADLLPTPDGRGEVRIDILDDGPGPCADAQEQAFRPGFTTKPGNSGLGLAICDEIVRQLGGLVALEARPAAGDARGSGGGRFAVRCPTPARVI